MAIDPDHAPMLTDLRELEAPAGLDAEGAALIAGMLDLPPVEDLPQYLDGLDPRWRGLLDHVMRYFDPASLPRFVQPFVPGAITALAAKLSADPEGSRRGVLELIRVAVAELGITSDELAGMWDAAGLPYRAARAG